jgi:Xaa-Pro aminopeptidase
MAARDIGVMVLTNPVNIRYATDVSVMPIWTANNLARYAVVPVVGKPVLFEYGKALFHATALWPDSRPAQPWQHRFSQHLAIPAARAWADNIKELMGRWGVANTKVAVDILDAYGFQALQSAGLQVVDADEPLHHAHYIKTPDEIALIRRSCAVADAAMFEMQEAVRPGISENELLGIFWGQMQSLGGEHCSTRLICSGERTNPWFYEASDRTVCPGDLVAIDTDMIGPHGYLCDISRTFLCGEKANPVQREAYRVAYDYIEQVVALCRPGIPYRELMERAPKCPPEYMEQAYSCMIHGDGMDDEPPFFPYPHDLAKMQLPPSHVTDHLALVEGMVLSVEFYAGKKGKRDGVKLEEQILITSSGTVLLSQYPHDETLLGNRS